MPKPNRHHQEHSCSGQQWEKATKWHFTAWATAIVLCNIYKLNKGSKLLSKWGLLNKCHLKDSLGNEQISFSVRVLLYADHEKYLCLSLSWFTVWSLCGNKWQRVFEMFYFGKFIGEVNLGKLGIFLWFQGKKIWRGLQTKISGLCYFPETSSAVARLEELEMRSVVGMGPKGCFVSSSSAQWEGGGKGVDKQKWKGCHI